MATQEYIDNMQQTIDNLPDFTQVAYTEEEEVQNEVQRRKMDQQRKYRQSLPFEERKRFDRMQIDRRLQKTKNDEEWAAGADERDRVERNEARLRAENPFYDYDQSSVGVESNINRRNLQQEMDDAQRQIGRFALYSPEQKEASRNYQNLRDAMNIFDAQLGESRESWQKKSSPQNGPRMQAPSSKRVGKYDGKTSAEVRNAMLMEGGYRDSSGATIPYADRNQGKPGQKGRGQARGMPQEFMQSPAMAQKRKAWTPYNARTGQDLKGEQLDDRYRREAEGWRRGSMQPKDGITTNPYYQGIKNDQYLKNKRATEHRMTNYQNPSAARNYYQNLYS